MFDAHHVNNAGFDYWSVTSLDECRQEGDRAKASGNPTSYHPNGVQFQGPDAESRAMEYAAWMNTKIGAAHV